MDNFIQAVQSPKSWNSMCYICLKTTLLHLKHYLHIYLTLYSTDVWFEEWHEEYSKFFPEHSKLGFWWDALIQTWKSMSLKSTEELSVMTMKNYAKFEEERTWGIWRILICALESLKNCLSNGFLLSKVYIFWTKKVQRSYLSSNWKGMQNLLEWNHRLRNWHKELDKFWTEQSKVSKIFTLMRSFWAKYKLFELKKYRGVIFHGTEEGCKVWRGIDLSFRN